MQIQFLVRIFCGCFLICFVGCSPAEEPPQKDDVELAKVFNKTLYLSELDGMIPEGASPEDSSNIVNSELERWVRETLLMQEAEQNIPKDLNIDDLVRNYRASLIRHNYEKILAETQLDSTITDAQLNKYYEKNKEQYQLESSILRCHLIKIPRNAPNLNQLKTWWSTNNAESLNKMKDYCAQNAAIYLLEDDKWYNIENIENQLPKGTNLNPNQNLTQTDDQFQYFFKVLEKKSQKEIAPLAYIQDQAKKVILHKRKRELLEKKKEELYERETRRNNVKIFTH